MKRSDLKQKIKKHLELLPSLKERLDKNRLEQDYIPGKPLKLKTKNDIKHNSEAWKAMEKWELEYAFMLKELKNRQKTS